MATFSIMTPFGGGSGYDPTSSIVESFINNGFGNMISGYVGNYFGKKSSKKQMQMAVDFARWQALNMPKLTKQGLIDAGYNPLLALGGSFGGGSSPAMFSAYQHMANHSSTSSGGVSVTPYEGKQKKAAANVAEEESKQSELQTEILKMEKDAQASETSARAAQAFVDEIEAEATSKALTGVLPEVYVDGKPTYRTSAMQSKQFDRLVEKLENQIDRDAYMNSKEHALYEDTINAVHGINQGASAYDHWRSGRRKIEPSRHHRR